MHVAIVTNHSITSIGGGTKFVLRLAKALRKYKVSISIYSLPIECKSHVNLGEIGLHNVNYYEAWRHSVVADVVYLIYSPFISLLPIKLRAPVIASIHSDLLIPELQDISAFTCDPITLLKRLGLLGAFSYYSRRVMKVELRRFDALHIYPCLMGKVSHKRFFVIPPFIDADFFKPTTMKSEEFVVLFVGRRIYQKGWDVFLTVARLVKRMGLRMRFYATGGRKGEVVNGVESLGYVSEEELRDVYSAAHVVLYPTRTDTWGQVILESLACGTPVITSDILAHRIPNLPVILAHGMADVVRHLIHLYRMYHHERESYFELCKRCREAVVKFYDEDVVAPRYLKMFEEVAEVGRA
jgi:glycosyltransferase involved in cell wall biosynthesis